MAILQPYLGSQVNALLGPVGEAMERRFRLDALSTVPRLAPRLTLLLNPILTLILTLTLTLNLTLALTLARCRCSHRSPCRSARAYSTVSRRYLSLQPYSNPNPDPSPNPNPNLLDLLEEVPNAHGEAILP